MTSTTPTVICETGKRIASTGRWSNAFILRCCGDDEQDARFLYALLYVLEVNRAQTATKSWWISNILGREYQGRSEWKQCEKWFTRLPFVRSSSFASGGKIYDGYTIDWNKMSELNGGYHNPNH